MPPRLLTIPLIVLAACLVGFWGIAQVEALDTAKIPSLAKVCNASNFLQDTQDGAGCSLGPSMFAKSTDATSFWFSYDPSSGVNVRFYLRIQKGNAQLSIQPEGADMMLMHSTGPGGEVALALPNRLDGWDQLNATSYNWIVTISNMDVITIWNLQIDATDDSTTLNSKTRKVLSEVYSECCSPVVQAGSLDHSPCQQLLDWSMEPLQSGKQQKLSLNNDACRYPLNLCDADGNLKALVLDGSKMLPGGRILTAPFAKCKTPPAALGQLTELYHLELVQMGASWDLGETLEVLQPLEKLRHLYLPLNNLHGELGKEKVCNFFEKGPKLQALSLSNTPVVGGQVVDTPTYIRNDIAGEVDKCIFDSALELLNLDDTRVERVPELVVNTPLKSLSMKGGSSRGGGSEDGPETLPISLAYATKLAHLDLSGRMLSGRLTGLPKSLVSVDLSRNNFEGAVPDLGSFPSLVSLDISTSTKLTGNIIAGVANCSTLEFLDLSSTSVSGDLGLSRWSLPSLKYLNLGMTKVMGDLGRSVWDMPALETLDLFSVNVHGQLHGNAWNVPALKNLVMHHTYVEGLVPPFLAKLSQLEYLDFHSNPLIVSQAAFAATLSVGNKINTYRVFNCSIHDLPEGLMHLGVFTRDCSAPRTALTPPERQAEWHKEFDISGNAIEDQALPSWLLGPFPSTCFAAGSDLTAPSGTNLPGKVQLKLQLPRPPTEFGTDNRIGCGDVMPSQEAIEFMEKHVVMGISFYCLDGANQPKNILDAMRENYRLAAAGGNTGSTGAPVQSSRSSGHEALPPAHEGSKEVSTPDMQAWMRDAGYSGPSSHSKSLTPAQLAGLVASVVLGSTILISVFVVVFVRGHRRNHRHGAKGNFSVPLAAMDSMAKSPDLLIVPMPSGPLLSVDKGFDVEK